MSAYSEFDSTDLKVRKYIMASFLYYRLNESIMPDSDFDYLCQDLVSEFEAIQPEYKERNNLALEDLKSGTGFALKFTLRDIWGAVAWAKRILGKDVSYDAESHLPKAVQPAEDMDFL